MAKRKICVVTGSRAEYGILYSVIKKIQGDKDLILQLIVTGMHLSPNFGLTYKVIEADGFRVDAMVEMQLSSDTEIGVTKSIGLGVIGFADALNNLQPDILVVLGDRYEIFAATQAALIAKIPVAHIAGGDTTEGAFDEAIRHSITKMAHLHFVTNAIAAQRVKQMGENPKYIFNFGSPGIDYIKGLKLFSKKEVEKKLGFKFKDKNLLVTFHPATLDAISVVTQFKALLAALDFFGDKIGIIFTKPNSDTGSSVIGKLIDLYVSTHHNSMGYVSLGQTMYLNTIAKVDVVVGNSSSGLYEVPSFHKPTVNIGDRQKGRLFASSVINCSAKTREIIVAIEKAFQLDCSTALNPYGDGKSSSRIVRKLKSISDISLLLKKHFFEIKS